MKSAIVALCLLALPAGAQEIPAPTNGIAALEKKYNVRVVRDVPSFSVKTSYGPITGKPADKKLLASYLPLFVAEWNLYPAELVARTGLRHIILCQDLAYNGQRRTAIPDFEHNDLYYDVTQGRYNESYVRKVIHHEYFHLIDWRDDGQVYSDPSWAALNAPGFRYGSGGAAVQGDSSVSVSTDSIPGFLNKYGTAGVEEDKAELFAALMVEPERVRRRVLTDRVLAAKVVRLKLLLAVFVPPRGTPFWERTRTGAEEKRPTGTKPEGL